MTGGATGAWLVRVAAAAARREGPPPPAPGLDPDTGLRLAIRHGLVAFLPAASPPMLATRAAATAALQRAEARGRLSVLRAAASAIEPVTACSVKGPLLAERAYGDVGARPPGDLDLLVLPEDLAAAHERLARAGAVPRNPPRDLRRPPAGLPSALYELSGIPVHLHWDLRNSPATRGLARLPLSALETEPTPGGPANLRVLAPADAALHLAEHALRSAYDRLLLLVDLARLLAAAPPEPGRLAARAATLGLGSPWRIARAALASVLGVEAPAAPGGTRPAEARLAAALARDPLGGVSRARATLVAVPGLRARLALAADALCPPAERLRRMYFETPGRATISLRARRLAALAGLR
ncbi:MAG: nucleotidyltransferase family protein [Planctomycetales bacterium]|nr:nucleotidyltransferase family protein [Planctomycetales bacterium]